MPTTRSRQELEALRAEAEKRVRLGESRAGVARALGVSLNTLSQWAHAGGWRKKDIEAECDGDLSRKAGALLERLNAEEAAAKAEAERLGMLARKMVEAAEASRDAALAAEAGAREELDAALAKASRVFEEMGATKIGGRVVAMLGGREEAVGGDGDAEAGEAGEGVDVTSEASTLESMAKAKGYLEAGRLEEAERAARVAWRLRSTADKLEVRQERLRLLFEEKLVAAAEARKKAVVPGFYPDRDPKNYEEKIDVCGQTIMRLAFLTRRPPAEVEMEYSGCMGFKWPGAEDAPWFKGGCMKGTPNDDPDPPVRSFAQAYPDEEEKRELTVKEKAEVVYLRSLLRTWGKEADPFNREWRIADARRHGESEYRSLRRHAPEMWKGLVLEEAPEE